MIAILHYHESLAGYPTSLALARRFRQACGASFSSHAKREGKSGIYFTCKIPHSAKSFENVRYGMVARRKDVVVHRRADRVYIPCERFQQHAHSDGCVVAVSFLLRVTAIVRQVLRVILRVRVCVRKRMPRNSTILNVYGKKAHELNMTSVCSRAS